MTTVEPPQALLCPGGIRRDSLVMGERCKQNQGVEAGQNEERKGNQGEGPEEMVPAD